MKRYLIIVENKDLVKVVMENIYSKASEFKLKGKLQSSLGGENYYKNEDTFIQVATKDENVRSMYFDEVIDVTLKSLLKQHTSTLTNSLFDEVLVSLNEDGMSKGLCPLSPSTHDNENLEDLPKGTKIITNKEVIELLNNKYDEIKKENDDMFNQDGKFTLEQIQKAQAFANLLVTLNKAGLTRVEHATNLIKSVNGITDTEIVKVGTDKIGRPLYKEMTVDKETKARELTLGEATVLTEDSKILPVINLTVNVDGLDKFKEDTQSIAKTLAESLKKLDKIEGGY